MATSLTRKGPPFVPAAPPGASPGVGKGGGPFLCFATLTSIGRLLVWCWPCCEMGAQKDQSSYNERGDEPNEDQKLLHGQRDLLLVKTLPHLPKTAASSGSRRGDFGEPPRPRNKTAEGRAEQSKRSAREKTRRARRREWFRIR